MKTFLGIVLILIVFAAVTGLFLGISWGIYALLAWAGAPKWVAVFAGLFYFLVAGFIYNARNSRR